MKIIIWKELRENSKWGLLALVVLLLATFYALSRSDERRDFQNNITLCHSTFLIVTSFGFALVGGAIACVQILPELKRDQWAALLHRPLPRWQILLAKIVVGLGLYSVATLIPLAACIVYAATPGNFAAPFIPELALPALSDWCTGLAIYSLALLMSLHTGRWWGSRGVLACAGAAIFVIHLQPRWPYAMPLLTFVLFLLAACGAIISSRVLARRPPLLRWAAIFSIFLGSYGLFALAVGGKLVLGAPSAVYSMGIVGFVIAPDGTLLYAKIDPDSKRNTVTDMAGRDVSAQYLGNGGSDFNYLYPFAYYFSGQSSRYLGPLPFLRNSSGSVQRVFLRADERENWFYLPRLRYFVGYDNMTRQSLGFCDREGFKHAPAEIIPFAENFSILDMGRSPDTITVQSGPEISKINFSERSITPFFTAGNEDIYGFTALSATHEKVTFSAVARSSGIVLLDAEGKQLWAIPYQRDINQWGGIGIATNQAEDRIYIQYSAIRLPPEGQLPLPNFVYVLDLNGKLLATYERPVDREKPPVSWSRPALIAISPPAILLGIQASALFEKNVIYHGTFPTPAVSKQELGLLAFGALVLAILTFVIARKQGRSKRDAFVWAVFVFLFGLPGLLTFRLASDWPVRARCPKCSARRALSRPTCPACGEMWAAPARSGAELLERFSTDP